MGTRLHQPNPPFKDSLPNHVHVHVINEFLHEKSSCCEGVTAQKKYLSLRSRCSVEVLLLKKAKYE